MILVAKGDVVTLELDETDDIEDDDTEDISFSLLFKEEDVTLLKDSFIKSSRLLFT